MEGDFIVLIEPNGFESMLSSVDSYSIYGWKQCGCKDSLWEMREIQ